MTVAELKREIIAVIAESTETDVKITEHTHLVRELGLSSVETMMMVSDLEDRFGVSIPGSKLRNVRRVKDLFQIILDELR